MNLTLIAGSIADSIKSWFEGLLGALLSIIPKLIYQITTALFAIIDAVQWLLRKFAGLDTIYKFGDQTNVENDLALQFINMIFSGSSPVLTNIFWSMIILGVLMLIITTMIAVVRSEYTATDSKSASKGKIIGNSLKALASFAIVPIVCFFGIYLSNVILQALDKVTTSTTTIDKTAEQYFQADRTTNGETTYNNYSFFGFHVPTSTTPISGMIFKAAAYSASRARSDTKYDGKTFYNIMCSNDNISAGGTFISNGIEAQEKNAALIDDAFANSYHLKTGSKIDRTPFEKYFMSKFNGSIIGSMSEDVLIEAGYSYFNKNNVALVWYYYDLWSFDFIIAIGSAVIVVTLLLYLVFGLIKRIFELVILFLVAAPITSIMPLDGGAALKKWREKFVAKTIGVYGPIVGLNLFFVILAILQTLELTGIAIIDKLVNLLFTIAGLAMVKDFTKMISELIGGEDAIGAGADKAKDIGATAVKVGKAAAGVGQLALNSTGIGRLGKAGVKAGSKAVKDKVEDIKEDVKDAKDSIKDKFDGAKSWIRGKVDDRLDKQSEKGKGRYKKGSLSYNQAVGNLAKKMTKEEKSQAALEAARKNGVTDKEKQEAEKNISDELVKYELLKEYKNKNYSGTFDELSDLANGEVSLNSKNAKRIRSKLAEEQAIKNKAQNMSDKDVAKYTFDNMDADQRKQLIDENYAGRSKKKNKEILQRAIDDAGGEKEWGHLSAEDKNKAFHSAHRALKDENAAKFGQNIAEGFTEGVQKGFGALASYMQDLGKSMAVFAQQTLGAMSGPMMEQMKGLSEISAIAQSKLTKQIAVDAETKNQKKLAAAQAAATESRGMGKDNRKQEEAPQKTELSESSISKLASAISNKTSSSTPTTLKIDDSSIDKLSNSIANKINKKDD